MAGVKLPTDELATKHLMVTKNQHKTILKIAEKEKKRVSVILEEMLVLYVAAQNELLYYFETGDDDSYVQWHYPDSIPE